MKAEDGGRNGAGKLVPLEIKISELSELRKISWERAGEMVKAEAESAEGSEV